MVRVLRCSSVSAWPIRVATHILQTRRCRSYSVNCCRLGLLPTAAVHGTAVRTVLYQVGGYDAGCIYEEDVEGPTAGGLETAVVPGINN